VFSLQTVPAREYELLGKGAAQSAGFSLHAGTAWKPTSGGSWSGSRYVSRPPVSLERLSLTVQGRARYWLKNPYRDGTTDIVLEPLDFIGNVAERVAVERRGRVRDVELAALAQHRSQDFREPAARRQNLDDAHRPQDGRT
jgi:hypothetical protein